MPIRRDASKPLSRAISRRTIMLGVAASALSPAIVQEASFQFGGPNADVRLPNDLIWGVTGHPITAYPGIPLAVQLDCVKQLGFTHYRINMRGEGPPEDFQTILHEARNRGICILPILEPQADIEKETPEALYSISYNLGRTMARRHRGQVRIWELANELENFAIIRPCEMRDDGTQYPCEWGLAGGVGPLEYYGPRWKKVSAILKGLSEGVIAGDPKAIRLIGTAGWGHLGAFERMVQDKIDWDITVWHDYQQVSEEFLKTLKGYGKPIWITEFNAGGGGSETPEVNAKMLTERIAYYRAMREKYDIAAAFVYELFDETYWGDTFEARQGLIAIEQTPEGGWRKGEIKPAGEAVKDALSSTGA